MKNTVTLLLLFLSLTVRAGEVWHASWIQACDCKNEKNTWQIFRKQVAVFKVPHKLPARICTDSKYWLYVNGRQVVFEGGLKRGPSPTGSYYDVVDLAPYFHSGQNTIALLTCYFGLGGFCHKSSGVGALLFDAEGGDFAIYSDQTWQAKVYQAYDSTGAPNPNIRFCESNVCFDGRKEIKDWMMPDCSTEFPAAEIYSTQAENGTFGTLVERPIPLFKDYGIHPYVRTDYDSKTHILHCYLPYNCQVTPILKVKSAAGGDSIKIQTETYHAGGVNSVRAVYITRAGLQEYESLGWMSGHDVQYTIPEGVEVVEMKYRETGYDTNLSGYIHCNDPFFNELWKRSARTVYVNMRDNYMDCPDRERAQWWGDETNDIMEAFYCLSPSSSALVVKGLLELCRWQKPDGVLFAPVPAGDWDRELTCQSLMAIGWYGAYAQTYYSGDDSYIPLIYSAIHKYLHNVWQRKPSGFLVMRPKVWNWADGGDDVDMECITNCWYYLALKAERQFALHLGRMADAAEDLLMMQKMEQNFDNTFWTGEGYRTKGFSGYDDRTQALCVVSGLASKDKYPALFKLFQTEFRASPFIELYVQEALFQMGQGHYALERAKKRFTPMLVPGVTTIYEGWEATGTCNHAFSAGMVPILSKYVCGISPIAPGFQTFRVCPDLAGLSEASVGVDTRYGMIEAQIKLEGSNLKVCVTAPKGTKGVVVVGTKQKTISSGKHNLSFKL